MCTISNPSVNSNSSYSPETLNSGQNWQFLYRVTLKFDGWPRKIISHLFYTMLSFVHRSKAMGEFKLELQSRNIQFGSKGQLFVPRDLESWWMTLENHRAPHLCGFKLCASFHSHRWIPIVVTARKRPIVVKISDFFVPCDLQIWRMTPKNNRTPLLCYFKVCVLFRSHWWLQTAVTVWKRPIWVNIDDF